MFMTSRQFVFTDSIGNPLGTSRGWDATSAFLNLERDKGKGFADSLEIVSHVVFNGKMVRTGPPRPARERRSRPT